MTPQVYAETICVECPHTESCSTACMLCISYQLTAFAEERVKEEMEKYVAPYYPISELTTRIRSSALEEAIHHFQGILLVLKHREPKKCECVEEVSITCDAHYIIHGVEAALDGIAMELKQSLKERK